MFLLGKTNTFINLDSDFIRSHIRIFRFFNQMKNCGTNRKITARVSKTATFTDRYIYLCVFHVSAFMLFI